MENVKVEKQNNIEPQGSQANPSSPSTAMQTQTTGQGNHLAQRSAWTPSLFSFSPREFFSASPFALMRRFSEEMDRAFENFGFARGNQWGFDNSQTGLWSPAVEVFERDNHLVVRAELPGLSKDDVNVEVTDEGLTIRGERKREHEESGEGWYRSERSYGQFHRFIPLPKGSSADQTQAHFVNGVLEVSVPVPEAQRRRTIQISETSGVQAPKAQAAGAGSNRK